MKKKKAFQHTPSLKHCIDCLKCQNWHILTLKNVLRYTWNSWISKLYFHFRHSAFFLFGAKLIKSTKRRSANEVEWKQKVKKKTLSVFIFCLPLLVACFLLFGLNDTLKVSCFFPFLLIYSTLAVKHCIAPWRIVSAILNATVLRLIYLFLVVCYMGRWHECRKLATAELWSSPSNEKKIFCKTVYYALCEVSRAFNLHQSSLETERNLNGALIKTLLFY